RKDLGHHQDAHGGYLDAGAVAGPSTSSYCFSTCPRKAETFCSMDRAMLARWPRARVIVWNASSVRKVSIGRQYGVCPVSRIRVATLRSYETATTGVETTCDRRTACRRHARTRSETRRKSRSCFTPSMGTTSALAPPLPVRLVSAFWTS